MEADVFPKNRPERSDLIDGSIGEGSPFHETFGYYAQGVGEKTATLPKGRGERLDRIRTENPQRRLRARRGLVGTAARWGHARDPRKPLVTASPSRYITCHE
jgi:hypothetical protein